MSFNQLGLDPEILESIALLGFETPTEIQQQAIPFILQNERDLIALAQTGTGKTGAFGLPSLQKVDPASHNVQVLVLSPTRELAIQIAKDIKAFAKQVRGVKTVAVYGGANISTQIKALKNGCQVVVGTPGRMLDLIKRRVLDVTDIHTLVLDEADEMLNMGFQEELDAILENTPEEKQTLLFSATMPKPIAKMAQKYMREPETIEVGQRNSGSKDVEHQYYVVHARDRYEALKRITDLNPDIYGIIFCRTRHETAEIAQKLTRDGYNIDLLNGDLSQAQRDAVMQKFRSRELQLLVATDVAARGLDVDHLTHVINYNLPDDLEVYIHRSGRTGRAGRKGISISIIHTREQRRIRSLEKMANKTFDRKMVPTGEEICGVRMVDMIKTVQNIEVNEEQIQKFLPHAEEALAELPREELIKRFVSIEFNHFLEYYKDAADLNVSAKGADRKRDRDRDRDRGERNAGRKERRGSSDFDRYFISVGKRDGLNPVRLMGAINEVLRGDKPDFGKIDIQTNFSFFEVEKGFQDSLFKTLNGAMFDDREIRIERADKKPAFKSSPKRKKDKGKRRRKD
ncbi:MAG: DEAD/DEAH box helicase [Bacteroidota bacterium]